MKFLNTVIFTLIIFSTIFGQDRCGSNSDWFNDQLSNFDPNTPYILSGDIKYIPFTIHYVRNTDGSAGQNASLEQLHHSIVMTNKMLSPIGIQIYIDGDINTINNSSYLNVTRGSADHQALLAMANSNTANIWVVDGWQGSTAVGWGGPITGIELSDISISTFPHEVGHFLGLPHTFATNFGVESVDRNTGNCATSGDRICDTEADPYGLTSGQITGEVLSHDNCSMTSNTRDSNGDLYTPPFDNIMSYYGGRCGWVFTNGQYDVMTAAYNQYHTGYTDISNTTLANSPINVTIVNQDNQDIISWTNASGALGTNLEISSDGGTSWEVIDGTVNGTSFNLQGIEGLNYKVRLKHINSLTYSEVLDYSPSETQQTIPVYQLGSDNELGSVASFQLFNTNIENTDNLNQNYSVREFSSNNQVIKGGTYDIQLKVKVDNVYFTTYFGVWIDKNMDGDFEDAGEELFTQAGQTSQLTVNGSITIPSDATPGLTRIRVRSFLQNGNNNAHDAFSRSETEDYVVEIIDESAPFNLTASYNTNTEEVDLTWEDNTTDFSYTIERSGNGFDFVEVSTIVAGSTTSSDNSALPHSNYEYRIRRENGLLTSNIATVSTENTSPTYCTALHNNGCSVIRINSFSIPSKSFSNTNSNCGDGYSDFSDQFFDVTAGEIINFNISTTTAVQGFGYLAIFVDVNGNGIFDDNERLYDHTNTSTAVSSGTFVIPSDASNGNTRLRIRRYYNSIPDGCGLTSFGETEDYSINISGGKPEGVIATSITDNTENSLTLNWTNGDPLTPDSYDIKISTDGVNFTTLVNIDANANSYITSNLEDDTRYVFQIITNAGLSSEPVLVWGNTEIDINNPDNPDTTTSISSITDNNDILLYPNPSIGTFTIEGEHEQIRIMNSIGQLVREFNRQEVYNCEDLESGTYLIEILAQNGTNTKKLIIQ